MKLPIVGIAILCLVPAFQVGANAQDAPLENNISVASTGITVSGHAEIDAKPDVAYAGLGVVTQSSSQDDAVAKNAAKSQAVKDALTASGIANADIETESYQVEPQYDYQSTPQVLTGYQVSNMIRVTIHDLSKAGLIVDKATQAGANQVDGVNYDLVNRHQVELQSLAQAVVLAHARAQVMADAAGVSLGRLINLTDSSSTPSPAPIYPMMMHAAMAPAAQPTTPLAPQMIDITSDVTALYSIGYGK
jgi:uncharacterized protein